MKKFGFTKLALACSPLLLASGQMLAQEGALLEEVVVTGIRGSLQAAIDQKRDSPNLKEVIISEDIGKLPDQNLAEVLPLRRAS